MVRVVLAAALTTLVSAHTFAQPAGKSVRPPAPVAGGAAAGGDGTAGSPGTGGTSGTSNGGTRDGSAVDGQAPASGTGGPSASGTGGATTEARGDGGTSTTGAGGREPTGTGGTGTAGAGGAFETPGIKSLGTAEPSATTKRIDNAQALARELVAKVAAMHARKTLTPTSAEAREVELNGWILLLDSLAARQTSYEERITNPRAEELPRLASEREAIARDVGAAEKAINAARSQLEELDADSGWKLVDTILRARCATAFCFDNGGAKHWLGIEPLVELPVGKSFGIGHTSLSDFVNNHDLRVDLAAGVRVWLFRDVVSVSLYISKPLNESPVRLKGSPFVYPGSSLRRPYPGIALGLLFDSIWLGFDRDELRNGDGQDGGITTAALNPDYPPNETISSAWTLTIALQPVTAFRTAIGTAVQATRESSK